MVEIVIFKLLLILFLLSNKIILNKHKFKMGCICKKPDNTENTAHFEQNQLPVALEPENIKEDEDKKNLNKLNVIKQFKTIRITC